MGVPQRRSRRFEEDKNLLHLPGADLNFLVPYFIFMYMHNNHCHRVTAQLQFIIIIIIVIVIVFGCVHKVLVGKPEGKRPLGRRRRRWDDDNIKMDLQEGGRGCGDWMKLAQDRDRWRAL